MNKRVYGFDSSGGLPLMCLHEFGTSADGQLIHLIDGNLRATVPPEGWESYVEQYPDAADVVSRMRTPTIINTENLMLPPIGGML